MKQRLTALLLAVLLLLTGCTPVDHSEQDWDYDFGTIPENIYKDLGHFAMDNGFIYISKWGFSGIQEYDLETGKLTEYPLPIRKHTAAVEPKQNAALTKGNLFFLEKGLCYLQFSLMKYPYQDESGKTQWYSRQERTLNVYNLETGESTPIEELGTNVYEVIPIKKKVDPNAETPVSADSDNPLAGMELYCFFDYDTFPEKAAQLALDGIILEEPKDPNERNRYNVLSIGRLDGDTRQLEVLFREAENFYMNDQYVYTRQTDANGNFVLYGSSLDQINFQPIDLEMVGGEITPYEDGFYFLRPESWDVCWYQNGVITELPIVSNSFVRWRDQLVYRDRHWTDEDPNGRMKCYDVNTGEIRDLGISAYLFSILGDRYLICEQDTGEYIIDILLDLETGEQKELYRMES